MFFFQAEDGIRDLVRSRGLGDVYKRQALSADTQAPRVLLDAAPAQSATNPTLTGQVLDNPVSYTHLTLPTSDLV